MEEKTNENPNNPIIEMFGNSGENMELSERIDDLSGKIRDLSIQVFIVTIFVVSLCFITPIGLSGCMRHTDAVKADTDILLDAYHREIEENEILWSYIENIDTFKSLDDAVKYRDDLIEQLQFLDE